MEDEIPATLDDFTFTKTIVNVNDIKKFNTEDQFTELAVELLKEISTISALVACTYRLDSHGNPRKWTRNEAIVGGLMVRISKLQSAFLEQICQNQLEIANILSRSLVESIFNLIYLLKNNSNQLYDSYIEDSLKIEKELFDRIEGNIKSRGYKLDIETRMLESIERVFTISSHSIEQVTAKRRNTWGGSIYHRLKDIGMEEMYLVFMSLASHSVHGNWQDLLDHHLKYENGEFSPQIHWSHSRPQPIFATCILSAEANKWYLETVIEESSDQERLKKMNSDVLIRTRAADELHEQYLNQKN